MHKLPGFGLATAKVGVRPGRILPLKPERKTTLELHMVLARG